MALVFSHLNTMSATKSVPTSLLRLFIMATLNNYSHNYYNTLPSSLRSLAAQNWIPLTAHVSTLSLFLLVYTVRNVDSPLFFWHVLLLLWTLFVPQLLFTINLGISRLVSNIQLNPDKTSPGYALNIPSN